MRTAVRYARFTFELDGWARVQILTHPLRYARPRTPPSDHLPRRTQSSIALRPYRCKVSAPPPAKCQSAKLETQPKASFEACHGNIATPPPGATTTTTTDPCLVFRLAVPRLVERRAHDLGPARRICRRGIEVARLARHTCVMAHACAYTGTWGAQSAWASSSARRRECYCGRTHSPPSSMSTSFCDAPASRAFSRGILAAFAWPSVATPVSKIGQPRCAQGVRLWAAT